MNGRRNVTELIEDTIIPQSTPSRLVMRMERDGLVTRTPDSHDSRVMWLDLSPRGRQVFEDIWPSGYAEYLRVADLLSEEEEHQLTALLQRLVAEVCV